MIDGSTAERRGFERPRIHDGVTEDVDDFARVRRDGASPMSRIADNEAALRQSLDDDRLRSRCHGHQVDVAREARAGSNMQPNGETSDEAGVVPDASGEVRRELDQPIHDSRLAPQ